MAGAPLSPLLPEEVRAVVRMHAELAKYLGIARPGHAGAYAYYRSTGLGHQETKDVIARLVQAASMRFKDVLAFP